VSARFGEQIGARASNALAMTTVRTQQLLDLVSDAIARLP